MFRNVVFAAALLAAPVFAQQLTTQSTLPAPPSPAVSSYGSTGVSNANPASTMVAPAVASNPSITPMTTSPAPVSGATSSFNPSLGVFATTNGFDGANLNPARTPSLGSSASQNAGQREFCNGVLGGAC